MLCDQQFLTGLGMEIPFDAAAFLIGAINLPTAPIFLDEAYRSTRAGQFVRQIFLNDPVCRVHGRAGHAAGGIGGGERRSQERRDAENADHASCLFAVS